MNETNAVFNDQRHKFETIKHKIRQILCGGEEKKISLNDKNRYKGTLENIPERAQKAFSYLLEQSKEFDFSESADFIAYETLFYYLITEAHSYQHDCAQSDGLISIEAAKGILGERLYGYFSLIYSIVQWEFKCWIKERDKAREAKMRAEAIKVARAIVASLPVVGHTILAASDITAAVSDGFAAAMRMSAKFTKDNWRVIKEIASEAHKIFPAGELANRIMLISDLQIMYGFERRENIDDLSTEGLEKYFDIRETFVLDCFSERFENIGEPLGWITGLPYIETGSVDNTYAAVFDDSTDKKELHDLYFEIMMIPAKFLQVEKLFIPLIGRSYKKQKELTDALQKAQDEKRQIIDDFAHTYGNMRATTLHDIGTQLINQKNAYLHMWGRKVMVEYAIKENLSREVDMLKLQFEDNISELLFKLRDSAASSDGLTVSGIVSGALQRCFIALLYGETNSDRNRRKLFFGTDDNARQREELQDSFDEEVLINETDMLTWLENNSILKIFVDISGGWEKLRFEKDGYSALLITNWLAELLTNALKYADKSKPITLSFTQRGDALCIGISNVIDPVTKSIHGNRKGVSSIGARISRLNQAVEYTDDPVSLNSADTEYQLRLYVASALFSG